MRIPDKSPRLLLCLALTAIAAGCSGPAPDPPEAGSAVLYWLGADADALVRCSVANQCGDGDTNFGALASLTVGGGELEHSRSYVRFYMPVFPPGTTVVRAQLELFHGGTREDGTTDDVRLEVARAPGPWKPLEVTWNEQPLSSTIGTETKLTLVSKGWSAADVSAAVASHIADPATNQGFVVFTPAHMQIEKGFDSNSHTSRTVDELGHAPRLLLQVERPPEGDVSWPEAFPEDTDLPFPGEQVAIAEAADGEAWPEAWGAGLTARCGP